MMREKFESWFALLGGRSHRSVGYKLLTSPGPSPARHPALQEFESKLVEELDALRKSGEELGFLSIDWLLQALSVVVSTHADVQALMIPSLTRKDDEWVREYMDDSAKLLEVCDALKRGIADVEGYPRLVRSALRWLDGEDRSYYRARKALLDCMGERWRGAELERCRSMLRAMTKKIVNPKGDFFNVAICGAKVTTIYLCSFILAALARRPLVRRPPIPVHVSERWLWWRSLRNLSRRVKQEIDERNTKARTVALLAELSTVDALVRRVHGTVDAKLKSSIPLLGELPTVDVLMRRFHGVAEKSALHVNTSEAEELRSLAASLDARSTSLARGLDSLSRCIDELSNLLVHNSSALLHMKFQA